MQAPKDIFINCDDLDRLPLLNRQNYEFEHELLVNKLPKHASVLQVGSMDGRRAIRLLEVRPDLKFTGLEIEEPLIDLARANVKNAGVNATFVAGDITAPLADLSNFDFVICLNNTLGYISEERQARDNMKRLGRQVFVSVFGEAFTDTLAHEYFASMGLMIKRIENDRFMLAEFNEVRRYTKSQVQDWGQIVTRTPLGYLCLIMPA
jgi:SAM-dependent methyltransferase